MNLEIDFTAIYYFLWSLCMLFYVAGVGEALCECTKELKSTIVSLADTRRDMNAVASALKRGDQAKLWADTQPV